MLLASMLAAVAGPAAVPAAAIPGRSSRGVILTVGAAVALSGVASRQWPIVTLGPVLQRTGHDLP